jgi:hypothetical protein
MATLEGRLRSPGNSVPKKAELCTILYRMCLSTSASSRQPRCRASIRTKPTTLLIGPRWCPLSRADTRRTKGKAYATPGSIQGRVPRLSPGNDPCRHRAASNPNGVGNLHVQLQCMRSYHIQSRRNAVGRTSAKPSKQGPRPSLIGPEWRPVPPSESPGRPVPALRIPTLYPPVEASRRRAERGRTGGHAPRHYRRRVGTSLGPATAGPPAGCSS